MKVDFDQNYSRGFSQCPFINVPVNFSLNVSGYFKDDTFVVAQLPQLPNCMKVYLIILDCIARKANTSRLLDYGYCKYI